MGFFEMIVGVIALIFAIIFFILMSCLIGHICMSIMVKLKQLGL